MKSWSTYLAEIRARCEAATPDPWFICGEEVRFDYSPSTTESGAADATVSVCQTYRISEELDGGKYNRKFIAHSRTDIPLLVSRIEELEGALRNAIEFVRCPNAQALLDKPVPE